MDRQTVLQIMNEERFVIILRGVPLEKLPNTAKVLVKAGIRLAEVTFDQRSRSPEKDYRQAVECIRATVGDALLLGAGTVMTDRQLDVAYDNGASFIVSPNTDRVIIEKTRKRELVSLPGALTPSEIASAWNYGADIVKLFPAYAMGLAYIRNVCEAISQVPLLGTGGCNADTIPEYWAAGVHYFGTGLVTSRNILAKDDYEGMYRSAVAHRDAIRQARKA